MNLIQKLLYFLGWKTKKHTETEPATHHPIIPHDVNCYSSDFPPALMQNFTLLEEAWEKGLLTEDEFLLAEDKAVRLYQDITKTSEYFYETYRLAIQRVGNLPVEE
ncbi:hypothetical protein ZMO1_ZMO1205 [Zymomonas mobilis subsp. mobilis ZM4 = ATCC 31821]|uniref:Uncharacterized protein n=3 Tax=Zymomonas mobilis TaxID=542 RepID=Q5NN81_ZYMMO|nr:hypothetical protein [Zymomonas mobilis]AAV89829.1 hypothetical protein ZMO1205 [Zymomonas mobilis subsp. mobilis ZM4 = ATCC 31821]ACV74680.1 hypothetical protein Za10_0126 [Zymomonas mobilis subsp. mobilis NCIMB 11163]AEH61980.1 conserved hypothetical protein [Zymomonas mobilis subsp. mobilis ATCC 10988]AVZ26086.1 hypothetical protein ZMO2_ZMO1205 [Zymomonas mobilis subsp. mobilis]AVZ27977.1 hypothetical protein ZMO3_ZMO1205 [Zymomonas mobilis subsp. mobilis]